ncbi:MAG: hypothetical protein HYX86_03495 [Chloroflexi bacterium]|nr:hypothetical protein [Chloroflexota bacterium]
MVKWMRYGYVIFAWLFVASILIQVFIAGLSLFASPLYWKDHIGFGYTVVHGMAFLTLVFVFLGRLPRPTIGRTAVPVVISFILPIFTFFRSNAPAVAALHPVFALVLFWTALSVARQARVFVGPPLGTGPAV